MPVFGFPTNRLLFLSCFGILPGLSFLQFYCTLAAADVSIRVRGGVVRIRRTEGAIATVVQVRPEIHTAENEPPTATPQPSPHFDRLSEQGGSKKGFVYLYFKIINNSIKSVISKKSTLRGYFKADFFFCPVSASLKSEDLRLIRLRQHGSRRRS